MKVFVALLREVLWWCKQRGVALCCDALCCDALCCVCCVALCGCKDCVFIMTHARVGVLRGCGVLWTYYMRCVCVLKFRALRCVVHQTREERNSVLRFTHTWTIPRRFLQKSYKKIINLILRHYWMFSIHPCTCGAVLFGNTERAHFYWDLQVYTHVFTQI